MTSAALRDALAGRGGFALVEESGAVKAPPAGRFAAWSGRLVLWPLGHRAADVWALLGALADGVVPVIVPAGWPAARLAAMRVRYPRFGYFRNEEILAGGDAACGAGDAVPSPDARLVFGLLTSGSTGDPKVVAAGRDQLARGIAAIAASQGLSGIGSTGVLLPLAYSYALVNQLLWAVTAGARVVLTPGLGTPADTLRLLRAAGAELLCLVPHQARQLLRLGFGAAEALPAVRVVNLAGAPFPVASLAGLRVLFPGAEVTNNYGCTEAMPRLTCARVGTGPPAAGDVGQPIGDIALAIEGGAAEGPILFQGGSVSLGTVTAEGALVPHPAWIATGDHGFLADGRLHVLGRHDQVVKVHGERVSLIEVEQALLAGGAEHAAAWLERNPDGDEAVAAVVGASAAPPSRALAQALGAVFARAVWPARIHWTRDWPLLTNGKTDRERLKALVAGGGLRSCWP